MEHAAVEQVVVCGRTFARTVDALYDFAADEAEIIPQCYPIEEVTEWAWHSIEGAYEPVTADCLIRGHCVITLPGPLGAPGWRAGVKYTGGYVLPGDLDPTPIPDAYPPVRLPADVEHAAVEQVAAWFLQREKVGLVRHWPSGGTFSVMENAPLLAGVSSILGKYVRLGV